MDWRCSSAMAYSMGVAAPGTEAAWLGDLAAAAERERSQRPSIIPTTARESAVRTGEPLCPRVTAWLRRKTLAAGADFSSCVDSYERTWLGERSSRGASRLCAS